ncbi:hypothetical protein [Calidifontibacter indicus]|uniref:Uncharacterized protein n=1 Tax=Calidifontibacter indicus TaxID=419650 RepID=A0A3D9UVK9_9MICO|nr:hypothetical protein [Calidifontibacter indicus]REF30034.1 hypothetical protein DFJ65_1027 [Calidifontibacter indicus]
MEDIAQVQEVLKKIDKAGLAFVATRLASSTEPFIWLAEINWHKHKGKERLFGEYFVPDELEKVVGKRLRQGDYRDATDPLDLERLERDASGLEKFLYVTAGSLAFKSECLRQASNRLTRRTLGSPIVRLASISGK